MKEWKWHLTQKGRQYLVGEGYDLTKVVDSQGFIKDLYIGGTVIYGEDYVTAIEVPSPYKDYIDADIEGFERWRQQRNTDDT